MTDKQKNEIVGFRANGLTYAEIAKKLGLSINTVKSYYRRRKDETQNICLCCGVPVIQPKAVRKKKFCSDECRMKWWNAHGCDVKRKAVYDFTCGYCGRAFQAYGNNHRKYCSRTCYITDRFKGGDGSE